MHNLSYENELNLHVNEISFSYEKMGTKTRFEEEAKGNSEMAYFCGWQKATKTKEMTDFKRTSNDCRFTYMLDFIPKPGRKLEYYENASLSKFEGNSSIDTCRKSWWKFVCAQRI